MNALDELREGLRAAAARDIESNRARSRRRRRRATGALVAVLLGGAAAAGAADLISVGEPVPDTRVQDPAYGRADSVRVQIAVTAKSDNPRLPYAVGLYDARNGDRCTLAGQARDGTLGVVEAGVFRPYAANRTGSCVKPGKALYDDINYGRRSLAYGLAPKGTRRVSVRGTPAQMKPALDGAFLFVFDGPVPPHGFQVVFE